MRNPLRLLQMCALASVLALPLRAEQVTIFAASSLKTALDQVIDSSGLDVVAVYGGSAAIARQISQGARADIVILAHPIWMDWLAEQDALQPETRCSLLRNELVLAGAAEAQDLSLKTAQDIIDALKGGRLAVGQLASVPAGQYTSAFLQNRGWLNAVTPHLAQTSNVRLALALVARGETALGFVYASDIFAEPRVRAVFKPDPSNYPAIRYPLALTKTAKILAQSVVRKIADEHEMFTQNGFLAVPQDEAGRCR